MFYEISPPFVIKAKIFLFKVSFLCASPRYHAKLLRKYVLYLRLLTVLFLPLHLHAQKGSVKANYYYRYK